MEGMDVGEVESLGHQLMNQGNTLQTIINAIDGIVTSMETAWRGSDATEFQGWWQSQHRPALMSAEVAVHGLGQSALNNAQQQIDASGMQSTGVLAGAALVGGVAVGGVAVGGAMSGSAASGVAGAQPGTGGPGAYVAPPSVSQLENGTFTIGGKQVTYTQWCNEHGYAPPDSNAGQCAAYAAFRRAQMGLPVSTGNGIDQASSVGRVTSTSEISSGSLISTGGAGGFGHVMVVDKVLGENPPRFQVSEMNAAGQSVNSPVINADNYRTNTVVTLYPPGTTGQISRTVVDGQGGTMNISDVTFCKGI
jgi:surface antigen/uncharacterized protein YukE